MWRHNNVLLSIYHAVKAQLAEVNKRAVVNEGKQPLPFVRAGQAPRRTKREKKQSTVVCFEERMIGNATLIYLSVALQVRLMCFPMTSASLKVRLTVTLSQGKGDSALELS